MCIRDRHWIMFWIVQFFYNYDLTVIVWLMYSIMLVCTTGLPHLQRVERNHRQNSDSLSWTLSCADAVNELLTLTILQGYLKRSLGRQRDNNSPSHFRIISLSVTHTYFHCCRQVTYRLQPIFTPWNTVYKNVVRMCEINENFVSLATRCLYTAHL